MERISIVGPSASGKTTLGMELSSRLGFPYFDLDDLYWLPGWQQRATDEFQHLVADVAAGNSWIVTGNYKSARHLVLERATVIIWLDFDLSLVLVRAFKRSLRRAWTKELCCNGNQEKLSNLLFSRESLLLWIVSTHRQLRRRYENESAMMQGRQVPVFRFRRPQDVEAYLSSL